MMSAIGGLVLGFVVGMYTRLFFDWLDGRKPKRPLFEAVDYSKVDSEHQLIGADGSVYRSEEGIVWYTFPEGRRDDDMRQRLEAEFERMKRVSKWLETGRPTMRVLPGGRRG